MSIVLSFSHPVSDSRISRSALFRFKARIQAIALILGEGVEGVEALGGDECLEGPAAEFLLTLDLWLLTYRAVYGLIAA